MSDDPFKAMVQKYDAAVVRGGGTTIFGPHRRTVLVAVREDAPKYYGAPKPPREAKCRCMKCGLYMRKSKTGWTCTTKDCDDYGA